MDYPFDKLFLVCTGARCNAETRGENRGELIRAELKERNRALGRKETVRVCAVSCLDLCDDGPNMLVFPEGRTYSHLNRTSAREVYDRHTGETPSSK